MKTITQTGGDIMYNVEEEIKALCDFVLAHSVRNSDNSKKNKEYEPVSCFLIEYCNKIRSRKDGEQRSGLKSIKQIISRYKSVYAAAKELKVSAVQLHRLSDANAVVDEAGQVWIKSKTKLNLTNKVLI